MKKIIITLLVALPMLAYAAPTSTFTATAPTQYEDGTVIPGSDVLTYTLYCGDTSGGPYNFSYAADNLVSVGESVDVATCVQGVPGTYYFVATAYSTAFAEESAFSNEASRSYTNGDLGRVPLPPTLFSVQ